MKIVKGLVCTILILTSCALVAQDYEDKVKIHGFGSWGFGITDHNIRFWMDSDGAMDFYDFALNLSAEVSNNLRVNAQFYTNSFLNDDDVEVDFAFAEYAFSDAFKLRAGKVKQAFGIYGDLKRVSVYRPFFNLPSTPYDHSFFVSAGYTGIGAVGTLELGDEWILDYDIYAGASSGEIAIRSLSYLGGLYFGVIPYEGDPAETFANFLIDLDTEDLLGAKLSLETPIEGLVLIGSIAQNHTVGYIRETGGIAYDTDVFTIAGSLTYDNGPFMLRAEGLYADFEGFATEYGMYWAEAGYMLTDDLQLVGRVEDSHGEAYGEASPLEDAIKAEFPDIFRDNREFAAGLNYFLSPNFILKVSAHRVEGILWSTPPRGLADYLEDNIDETTDYFIAGITFSF